MKIISVIVDEMPETCEECKYMKTVTVLKNKDAAFDTYCDLLIYLKNTIEFMNAPGWGRSLYCPLQPVQEKTGKSTQEVE